MFLHVYIFRIFCLFHSSQSSKWKCTLCHVSFTDRPSLYTHVKTPEHEAKIGASSTTSNVKPSPTINNVTNGHAPSPAFSNGSTASPSPQPSVSLKATYVEPASATLLPANSSVHLQNSEDLESMIRRICRDELSSMLRQELRSLLSPVLQDPPVTQTNAISRTDSEPSAKIQTSGAPLTRQLYDGDGPGIEMRGLMMHCLLCDASMSSQVNLEAHLLGKKHKSMLSRVNTEQQFRLNRSSAI